MRTSRKQNAKCLVREESIFIGDIHFTTGKKIIETFLGQGSPFQLLAPCNFNCHSKETTTLFGPSGHHVVFIFTVRNCTSV